MIYNIFIGLAIGIIFTIIIIGLISIMVIAGESDRNMQKKGNKKNGKK